MHATCCDDEWTPLSKRQNMLTRFERVRDPLLEEHHILTRFERVRDPLLEEHHILTRFERVRDPPRFNLCFLVAGTHMYPQNCL